MSYTEAQTPVPPDVHTGARGEQQPIGKHDQADARARTGSVLRLRARNTRARTRTMTTSTRTARMRSCPAHGT